MDDIFIKPASNDTFISGFKGSNIHSHETPFGAGHFTDQTTGEHFGHFNRFNDEVDALLSKAPIFGKFK